MPERSSSRLNLRNHLIRIFIIQRGYERFEEKLRSLGAVIERVSTEREIQKFKLKVG